jgi:hypothetical protein
LDLQSIVLHRASSTLLRTFTTIIEDQSHNVRPKDSEPTYSAIYFSSHGAKSVQRGSRRKVAAQQTRIVFSVDGRDALVKRTVAQVIPEHFVAAGCEREHTCFQQVIGLRTSRKGAEQACASIGIIRGDSGAVPSVASPRTGQLNPPTQ